MRHLSACPARLLPLLLVLPLAVEPTAVMAEEIVVRRLEDGVLFITFDKPRERKQKQPRQERAVLRSAPSESMARIIDHYSGRSGIDPRLVRSVIQVESAFNPRARSRKGALGLMQLMPETARELGIGNVWDVEENVRGGTTYLRRMLDRFDGDVELALAGYNAGPSAVERFGRVPPYRETRSYVRRVLALYRSGGATVPRVGQGQPVLVRNDPARGLVLFTPE